MKIKSLLFVLVLGICAVASAQNKTFFAYNSTASSVSLAGVNIPANSGMTLIVMASTLRGF